MPTSVRVPLPKTSGTVAKARPLALVPDANLRARGLEAQIRHCQKTVGNQAALRMVRTVFPQSVAQRTPLSARHLALQGWHARSRWGSAARSPIAPAGLLSDGTRLLKPASDALRLQRAWYNIDIPFTDYQFDPSIAGVKTAATFVKDKAVAGFEWAVDEIKSLVFAGIDWLTGKWKAIRQFAASAFDAARKALGNIIGLIRSPMGFLANALMNLDASALAKAWASFSGMVATVANGFNVVAGGLLQQISSIWGGINGFATSLLNRISSVTSNFLFRKLPQALQNVAFIVIDRLKSVWKSISEGWTSLYNKIKAWVDTALDTVFTFVRRVASFGINVVIAGVIEFGKIALFLKDLFSDPQKYAGLLARHSVQAFEGVESRFQAMASQYLDIPATVPPAAATRIHRTPAPDAAAEPRTSATWSEMGHGIVEVMGKKWNEFKSNPLGIVTGLLLDMIFPVVGNVKDVIHLFTEIKNIVTGPLHAESLQDAWTSLLRILDIPLLIYHTLVSILMRTMMLPLLVATFIPHPMVKGIAAAIGYGLLGAFVQVELLNIQHKVLLLKTGATTGAQKAEAYNRIADSLIAMAMTAVIMVVMMILHFIANLMKAIYNLIKGKVFGIPPAPAEGKASLPTEGDKPPQDTGGAESAKAREGLPSKDGNRKIRMNEEGKCEVCASPCDEIRRKYASVMTPEAQAKIKAIEEDASLSALAKEEALKPVEQELADLLNAKLASVKGPYAHLKDGTKVEPGRDFQPQQKVKILAENMKNNGGKLRSDNPADPHFGKELSPPAKGPFEPGKFPEVPPNQAQVDHIVPKIGPDGKPLGSNAYENAHVVSAEFNNIKNNKL